MSLAMKITKTTITGSVGTVEGTSGGKPVTLIGLAADLSGLVIGKSYKVSLTPFPSITSISVNRGPIAGGTSVVITGIGFTSASAVNFGVAAGEFTINSDTQITVAAPTVTNEGTVLVTVVGPLGTSNGNHFTYYDQPNVVSASPNAGSKLGGSSVLIVGSKFNGVTAITFGGNAATNIHVNSDTEIVCTTPPHAAGAVDIVVSNPIASGTGSSLYTYS